MSEMRTEISRATARTDAERRAASVAVAAFSTGEADCRELLAMLGLSSVPVGRKAIRITPGTSGWRPA